MQFSNCLLIKWGKIGTVAPNGLVMNQTRGMREAVDQVERSFLCWLLFTGD
jgi:hypothetical protein